MSGKMTLVSVEFLSMLLNLCSPVSALRLGDEAIFHPQILSTVKNKNLFESHLHVLLIVISTTWPSRCLGLEFEWLTDPRFPVTGYRNSFISMFCWRAKGCRGHSFQCFGVATL